MASKLDPECEEKDIAASMRERAWVQPLCSLYDANRSTQFIKDIVSYHKDHIPDLQRFVFHDPSEPFRVLPRFSGAVRKIPLRSMRASITLKE